jgi:hypothetical protein
MTFSKNGTALAVLIIEAFLSSIGVEFEAGSIEKVVEGMLIGAALIVMAWNQLMRPNVKAFFFKE